MGTSFHRPEDVKTPDPIFDWGRDAGALAGELSGRLGWDVRLTALTEPKSSGVSLRGDPVSEGRRCLVKIAPVGGFARSFAAYQVCADLPFVPNLLIPEVLSFGRFEALCLEFLDGESVDRVDRLDAARFDSLLRAYLAFSRSLEGVADRMPVPACETSDRLLSFLAETSRRGFFGEFALSGVLALDPASCRLGVGVQRVIHNDLHLGNLAFRGSELAAIYDLENIDFGLPCEDIVYLFAFQYLNCGVFRGDRGRLRSLLSRAVVELPWPREEWRRAIRRCRVKMAVAFVLSKSGRIGLKLALRMCRLDRLLQGLERLIVSDTGSCDGQI